jgi:hypothetical protein
MTARVVLFGMMFSLVMIKLVHAAEVSEERVTPVPAPLALRAGESADKKFYFAQILEISPGSMKVLSEDPELQRFAKNYHDRLSQALDNCSVDASCYVAASHITETEIASVESALCSVSGKSRELQDVARRLREAGIMIRFRQRSDEQLIGAAWRIVATEINEILDIYGDGLAPRFGVIDAMSLDPHSEEFGVLMKTAIRIVLETDIQTAFFLSDAVKLSELVLKINGRDEAERLEPLEQGENRLAFERVRNIQWSDYHYSTIIVPGIGPATADIRLSGGSRLHLDMAVTRYRQRVAPFILVSGGYVRPPGTQFSEAVQMKRELVERYGIPSNAILIDPQARHTTTNLRNAARILYRYGMPFAKPALVVTDEFQANMIMDQAFDERNARETGTLPYLDKRRISPLEVAIVPSREALQVNPIDPLDP